MADPLWTAVRLLHIGSAIALVGGATLWNFILAPTFQQMGPTLPKGFMPTVGGKVVRFLPNAALATLLTGALLFWFMMPFGSEAWRLLMLTSLALLVVSLGLAHGAMIPTFKRLSQAMGAAGPPGPEAQALMARMKMLGVVSLALAWVLVALMVVATALRTT